MTFPLVLAIALAAAGHLFFGHFEERAPWWKRLFKWALYFGVTAFLSWTADPSVVLAWVVGLPLLGTLYHVWWCRKHGIGVLSGEPKERYYRLRGWKGG